ncbi:MAG: hypothetical protein ACT4P4_22510 [Betaproteobacteria bacterium]
MNRGLIDSLCKEAQGHGADGAEPYLIEPDAEHLVSRLPAVSCIAVFDSGPLESDDAEPYSSLVVAWFQDEFGPIPSKILKLVDAVDWESCASPWCW